jgi:hypothetical protein
MAASRLLEKERRFFNRSRGGCSVCRCRGHGPFGARGAGMTVEGAGSICQTGCDPPPFPRSRPPGSPARAASWRGAPHPCHRWRISVVWRRIASTLISPARFSRADPQRVPQSPAFLPLSARSEHVSSHGWRLSGSIFASAASQGMRHDATLDVFDAPQMRQSCDTS